MPAPAPGVDALASNDCVSNANWLNLIKAGPPAWSAPTGKVEKFAVAEGLEHRKTESG